MKALVHNKLFDFKKYSTMAPHSLIFKCMFELVARLDKSCESFEKQITFYSFNIITISP